MNTHTIKAGDNTRGQGGGARRRWWQWHGGNQGQNWEGLGPSSRIAQGTEGWGSTTQTAGNRGKKQKKGAGKGEESHGRGTCNGVRKGAGNFNMVGKNKINLPNQVLLLLPCIRGITGRR